MPEPKSRELKVNSFLAKVRSLPHEGDDIDYQFEADGAHDLDEKIPELYLVAAVIEVALSDYVELRYNDQKRLEYTSRWIEVRQWIYSNEETEPFSFLWCLSHLFPEPQSVCKEIRKRVQNITKVEAYFFKEILKGNYKTFKMFNKNGLLSKKQQRDIMKTAA